MKDVTIKKLDNLNQKIGNTPTLYLDNGIYAKIEGNNPAGSIKDRVAFYMVKDALEGGELKESEVIVEATSGNTGIGLAYVARELDIDCTIVMPDSMSEERRKMILNYGANLILTPKKYGMQGSVDRAKELANDGGWLANQFGNPSCINAHYYGTAKEIFSTLNDVKYIVAGIGSGGTVMGIKKYIIDNNIDCKVVGVEPSASPLISKGYAGAHAIQGIGANFIPKILDVNMLDGIIAIDDDEAISGALKIYDEYSLKCGISSGAAYMATLKLRESVEGNILTIFPDSMDRYGDLMLKIK